MTIIRRDRRNIFLWVTRDLPGVALVSLVFDSNLSFDPFDSLYNFDFYAKGKARIKRNST